MLVRVLYFAFERSRRYPLRLPFIGFRMLSKRSYVLYKASKTQFVCVILPKLFIGFFKWLIFAFKRIVVPPFTLPLAKHKLRSDRRYNPHKESSAQLEAGFSTPSLFE